MRSFDEIKKAVANEIIWSWRYELKKAIDENAPHELLSELFKELDNAMVATGVYNAT